MNAIARGGVSGAAGTALMTVVMLSTAGANLVTGEMPPRRISGNFEQAMGVRELLPRPLFEASWLMQHFGYGTTAGAGYALVHEVLGKRSPVVSGSLFGIGLYLLGYACWLPLLDLYPPPTRCSALRNAMTVVEHLVYGSTVALTYRRLGPRGA